MSTHPPEANDLTEVEKFMDFLRRAATEPTDDAVAIYRALLVFLLIFAAMLIAYRQDERRERIYDEGQKEDAARRIREFQATQARARRR